MKKKPIHPQQQQQPASTLAAAAAAVGGEAAASNAAAATAAGAPAAAAPAAALATLRSAAPVDRLRYQALLIFDHFDADADGRLLPSELSAFLNYAGRKLMWSPGLSDVLARVRGECLGSLPPGGACSRERFLQVCVAVLLVVVYVCVFVSERGLVVSPPVFSSGLLFRNPGNSNTPPHQQTTPKTTKPKPKPKQTQLVRDQVHAVSCSPEYQRNELRPDAAARLQAQIGIPLQEICAAKWVFTLLDFDADGKVALADLDKAEGIERYYVDASLQDADEDEDGAIVFEEFLVSYAKPKPVWKNLIIMAANTLAIFLLLQVGWGARFVCVCACARVLPACILRA
jgi:hypothetical protein